ncbi:MAG: hypothetical protein U5L03_09715 [Burkholderiaceae bacterium]|nr:hypothetical protein [Burkholderiaceae bacterium]
MKNEKTTQSLAVSEVAADNNIGRPASPRTTDHIHTKGYWLAFAAMPARRQAIRPHFRCCDSARRRRPARSTRGEWLASGGIPHPRSKKRRLQSAFESINNRSLAMQTHVKADRDAIPYAGDVVQMKPPSAGYLGAAVTCASVSR